MLLNYTNRFSIRKKTLNCLPLKTRILMAQNTSFNHLMGMDRMTSEKKIN